MLDDWSNTNTDPNIAVTIHTGKDIHLFNVVDCESEKKTIIQC